MNKWELIFKNTKKTDNEEVKKLLELLQFKKTFKIINVVGTNGKGSVSSYIAQGLISKGKKVGLFSSPHILVPNERIKINDQQITDEEFFNIVDKLPEGIHFFALTYLAAMKHFENNQCDYVVLEAGIGGEKDTTKVIPGDYGVVTSISLDHTEILGKTESKIASNKAGIIQNKQKFAIPSHMKKTIKNVFIKKATEVGATLVEIDNEATSYRDRNKKLAQGVLKTLFKINFNDFKDLTGRTEIFDHNGLKTIFDVGHNLDGVKESIKLLQDDYDQVVLSFKSSKDTSEIPKLFEGKELFFYKVTPDYQSFDNMREIILLDTFFKKQNKRTLYIGSFYLIGALCQIKNALTE